MLGGGNTLRRGRRDDECVGMPGREQGDRRGVIPLERQHRAGSIGVRPRTDRAIVIGPDEQAPVAQEEEGPDDHAAIQPALGPVGHRGSVRSP
jgi:hypothetical protein